MPDAKVSITFKANQPQDPWIVFHGESVDEAAVMIKRATEIGMFPKVREVSEQFATGQVSTAQAVATIQQAMPGAQVVTQAPPDDPWAGTSASPPQQYQQPQQGYQQQPPPQYAQPQQQQAQPPQQLPPGFAPTCPHGTRNYVANGRYGPFWGCPAQRDDPSKCKAVSANK